MAKKDEGEQPLKKGKEPKDRGKMYVQITKILLQTVTPMLGSSAADPNIHAEHVMKDAEDQVRALEELKSVEMASGIKTSDEAIRLLIERIKDPKYEPTPEDAKALKEAIAKEQVEKSRTIFMKHPDNGRLHLLDYQIKGFLKEKTEHLIELNAVPESIGNYNLKKAVNAFFWVKPRFIWLIRPNVNVMEFLKYRDGDMMHEPDFSSAPKEIFYENADGDKIRPLQAETMQGKRVALANSQELKEGVQIVITFIQLVNDKSKLARMNRTHLLKILNQGAHIGLLQWRSGGYGRFRYKVLDQIDIEEDEALKYLEMQIEGEAVIPAKTDFEKLRQQAAKSTSK
jgi:hypothetical protein